MIDKAGGPVTVLASPLTAPWAITRDAGFVYWLASGNLGCGTGHWARTPRGCVSVTLLSGALCGADLATDGAELFFFTGDGTVARAPVAGGALTHLSEPLEEPCGLGWLDQNADRPHCAYGFGGTVWKQPKVGGAAVPVAALEAAMAVRFGVDDGTLYWTEWSDDPEDGADPRTKGSLTEVFVDGTPEAPYNLAFDATFVDWAELIGGRILRKREGPCSGAVSTTPPKSGVRRSRRFQRGMTYPGYPGASENSVRAVMPAGEQPKCPSAAAQATRATAKAVPRLSCAIRANHV